jgi:hypothetical protein
MEFSSSCVKTRTFSESIWILFFLHHYSAISFVNFDSTEMLYRKERPTYTRMISQANCPLYVNSYFFVKYFDSKISVPTIGPFDVYLSKYFTEKYDLHVHVI